MSRHEYEDDLSEDFDDDVSEDLAEDDSETSSDDADEPDLSFVVSDEDEEGDDDDDDDNDDDDDDNDDDGAEEEADADEGISSENILPPGQRRTRNQSRRLEHDLFQQADVQQLYWDGASPDHVLASESESTDVSGSDYEDADFADETFESMESDSPPPPQLKPSKKKARPSLSPKHSSKLTKSAVGSAASAVGSAAAHGSHVSASQGASTQAMKRSADPCAKLQPSKRPSSYVSASSQPHSINQTGGGGAGPRHSSQGAAPVPRGSSLTQSLLNRDQ